MPFLIDGHNLIGKVNSISMQSSAKEAELVAMLRGYLIGAKKKGTVVFDCGMPGGTSRLLSTPNLKVLFASAGVSADDIIIDRIYKAQNPNGLIVVTSDNAIKREAKYKRCQHRDSAKFAQDMRNHKLGLGRGGDKSDVKLSANEVAEWEALFSQGKDD